MSKASPEERLKAVVVKRQQYSLEYEERLSEVVERLFEEFVTKLEGDSQAIRGDLVSYDLRRTALDVILDDRLVRLSESRVLNLLVDKFDDYGVYFKLSADQDIHSHNLCVELRIRLIS